MHFARIVQISIGGMMLIFFTRCGTVNIPEECAEIEANATVCGVGFSSVDSCLSILFINSLSHCPSEIPYLKSRLDISLDDFQGSYESRKSENPEEFRLESDEEFLFSGEIACFSSCTVSIPVGLPGIELAYVREEFGAIVVSIDTNGTFAKSFDIWGHN